MLCYAVLCYAVLCYAVAMKAEVDHIEVGRDCRKEIQLLRAIGALKERGACMASHRNDIASHMA